MNDQPKERRRGYSELKQELHRFFRRVWGVTIVIGLACFVGLAGLSLLIKHEHEDALRLCENQNIRHDNALSALYAGSNQDQLNTDDKISAAEIRRRRDVTIGLIDALAPKTNCENPAPVKALPQVTPIPEAP